MILQIPWIMFFIQLTFANPKIKYVQKCPSNEERWKARDKEFGCNIHKNVYYHCILTSDEKLVELCIRNISIQSHHNGCPHVYISLTNKNKATFALPNSHCSTTVKGCPSSNRTSAFLSNQLYLYPMCLKPERQRIVKKETTIPSETTSTSTSLDISSTKQDDALFLNANDRYLSLPLLIVIILLLASILILFVAAFWRRIKCTGRRSRTEGFHTDKTEDEILLTGHAGRNDVHQIDEEKVLQANLLFDIAKGIMWKQVSLVKREDRYWEDILNEKQLKHQMYHQWQSNKCCNCNATEKRLKKIWGISGIGWSSLYLDTKKECKKGLRTCACRYNGRDIRKSSISIATLFTFTLFFGELSNEGRRHLKYLRQFCKEFLRSEGNETRGHFTEHLENALTNVAFHSRFHFVKEMQIDIRNLRNNIHKAEYTGKCFPLDFEDTTCFKDTQLDEKNIPLIKSETKDYINQKEFYVEVERVMEEGKKRLLNDKLLIVSGHPGDGRKSICRRLMKCMEIDSKLKLDYFQVDFDFFRNTREQHLVYFEDILGSSLYISLIGYERQTFMENVRVFRDLTTKNVHTLCSIEKCKLEEAISDLSENEQMEWKRYVMDLSSPESEWKLTQEEKSMVLKEFGQEYRARPLEERQIENILKSSSEDLYFGFFENCVLYFRFGKDYNVFHHPVQQLEEEIGSLQRNFPAEYIILTYMLFTNGQFNEKTYDRISFKNIRERITYGETERTQQIRDLSIPDKDIIEQAIRSSKLLLRTGETTYKFQHQFVKEAVLHYICQNESHQLLQLANISVIRDYVRPSTYKERWESEVFGLIEENCDQLLAKRLLENIDISKVPTLVSTWDKPFLENYLLKEIEDYFFQDNCSSDGKKKDIIGAMIDEAISEEDRKEGNEVFLSSLCARYSEPVSDNVVANAFYECLKQKTSLMQIRC